MNDENLTLETPNGSDVALDVLNEGTEAEAAVPAAEGTEEITRVFQQEELNPVQIA